MKRISLLTSIFIILSMLLAVAPVQAAGPESFHMDKACSNGICTITDATAPFDVFIGTAVAYDLYNYGPDSAGNFHMTAGITLTSAEDPQDTASGIVSWVYHNGDFTGHISLQRGTGDFEGVHAQGEIGLITFPTTFDFSGYYFIAP